MLSFHSLRAACSTYSRLHHRLPNSFKVVAISSLHLFEINIRRKSVFQSFKNYISDSRIRNYFQISSDYMTCCWTAIHFTISGLRSICINIEIWNKLIKIYKNDSSNRFVILIANHKGFHALKISWNGRNKRIVPEDTRQINKIHPFIYERNFNKIMFVINFRMDVRAKSMLSITSR